MPMAVSCQKPSSLIIGQSLTQGPNSTMTLIYLYSIPFWVKFCLGWLKKLPSNWHSSDNNCWCWLLVWAGWTIVENELFVVRKDCYRPQVSDLILAPILSYFSSSENFYGILRATKCWWMPGWGVMWQIMIDDILILLQFSILDTELGLATEMEVINLAV